MNFYIAASLSEFELVRSISKTLQKNGWKHTYDWTWNCFDVDINYEIIKDIAEQELIGVKDADIIIVLNPKGRGTHVELGMALALNKKVYLYHFDNNYFEKLDETVSFYWLPQINQISGNIDNALARIINENPTI